MTDQLKHHSTTKAREFDLTDCATAKAWMARITGPDPKYKLKREFVELDRKDGRHRYFTISEDGIYQTVEYSAKGNKHLHYYQHEGGKLTELQEADVLSLFNAPAQGQKPERRRSSCACTDGCCDNGCRCGSECNCNGGPIWSC